VGVVAADGVQDIDAVAAQLLGSDMQRVLAALDQAALDAVGDVGELYPAVADRAAPERVQAMRIGANLRSHLDGIAFEKASIAAQIGDDPNIRRDFGVALD